MSMKKMNIREMNSLILDSIDIESLKNRLPSDFFDEWTVRNALVENDELDIIAKQCTAQHYGFNSWSELLTTTRHRNITKTDIIKYYKKAKDKLAILAASIELYSPYIDNNTLNASPFVPIDLLNFIYGDNPKRKKYFNDDLKSLAQLIEYFNTEPHKTELSKSDLTIPEKMEYMFGKDWDNNQIHEWGHDNITLQNNNMTEQTNPEVLPSAETKPIVVQSYDLPTVDHSTHLSTDIKPYEMVNHPSHYNRYDKEAIDMMVDIWGKKNTALWCKMTAFKYRLRMGTKPDSSLEQDFNKEKWYLNKANELLQND